MDRGCAYASENVAKMSVYSGPVVLWFCFATKKFLKGLEDISFLLRAAGAASPLLHSSGWVVDLNGA